MTTAGHGKGTSPINVEDAVNFSQESKLRTRRFLPVEIVGRPDSCAITQRMPHEPETNNVNANTILPFTWAMNDIDSQYEAIMNSCVSHSQNLPGSADEIVPSAERSPPLDEGPGRSKTASETSRNTTFRYSANLARCLSKMVTASNNSRRSSTAESVQPATPNTQDPDQEFCPSPIDAKALAQKRSLLPLLNEGGFWNGKGRLFELGHKQPPQSPLYSSNAASPISLTTFCKGSPVSDCSPFRLSLWGAAAEGPQSRSMPNSPMMQNSSQAHKLGAQASQTRRRTSIIERAMKTLKRKDGKNRARARWIRATWWASQEAQRKASSIDMLAHHVITRAESAQQSKNSQGAIFPSYIQMCNMRAVQAVVILSSLFLVFGTDIYFSAAPPPHLDTAIYSIHTFCWCVLALELLMRMLLQRSYLLSFFFLLDLGALFSTLPEVIWFTAGVNVVRGTTFLSIVRGARAVRLSTKLARLLAALHVCAAEKRSNHGHASAFTFNSLDKTLRRHASDGIIVNVHYCILAL
jgi:hypothetical protein